MDGECGAGGNATADYTCVKCRACGAGQYLATSCEGTGSNDTVRCAWCTSACPPGFALAGSCDGTNAADGIMCLAVTPATTTRPASVTTPSPTPFMVTAVVRMEVTAADFVANKQAKFVQAIMAVTPKATSVTVLSVREVVSSSGRRAQQVRHSIALSPVESFLCPIFIASALSFLF